MSPKMRKCGDDYCEREELKEEQEQVKCIGLNWKSPCGVTQCPKRIKDIRLSKIIVKKCYIYIYISGFDMEF